MKSRDEIVIIMLQWLRLYTLGSRGSRELKTFLETRLISSRVDQKLKNKRGKYMLLKRKLGPKSWVMETIVEAVCCRRGGDSFGLGRGFNSATNRLVFSFNFASDLPRFRRDFRHDRATIGSRSGVDRGVRASSIACRSMGDKFALIPRQDLLDHATIVEFFHEIPPPSDEALIVMKIRRARKFHAASLEAVRSRSRDIQLMKIGRSRRVHVAKGKPCDHFA